jgi:hypothetical protein
LALSKPSLIRLTDGTTTWYLSDHNRSDVQETNEQIEKTSVSASGTKRKYVVAVKRSWSISWTMLPGLTSQTVDGGLGAANLKSFYDSNVDNTLSLSFYVGDTSAATGTGTLATPAYTATVFISSFNRTIKKRFGAGNQAIDYWDCQIDFTEA